MPLDGKVGRSHKPPAASSNAGAGLEFHWRACEREDSDLATPSHDQVSALS